MCGGGTLAEERLLVCREATELDLSKLWPLNRHEVLLRAAGGGGAGGAIVLAGCAAGPPAGGDRGPMPARGVPVVARDAGGTQRGAVLLPPKAEAVGGRRWVSLITISINGREIKRGTAMNIGDARISGRYAIPEFEGTSIPCFDLGADDLLLSRLRRESMMRGLCECSGILTKGGEGLGGS